MSLLGQLLNLLRSTLTILLTRPNNHTSMCYSNYPFLTVQVFKVCTYISSHWLLLTSCSRSHLRHPCYFTSPPSPCTLTYMYHPSLTSSPCIWFTNYHLVSCTVALHTFSMEQVPSCGIKLHRGHFILPTTVYLGIFSTQCTKSP